MKKLFNPAFILLLVFAMTACGQTVQNEADITGDKETSQVTERLIDTASAYGNEAEIGQAIREAIGEGIIRREDIFVITKIYPGDEMKNPERSVQACLDRLDIGYVDMMLLHHPDANDVKAYNVIEQFVADGNFRNRRSAQRILRTSHFAVEPAKKCGRDSRFR